jgi:ubiquinone biosynthesis monooxygenase Coq7
MTARQTAPKKTAPKKTADDRLPGDLTAEALVARMIRVDHAGEYGAARIYEGQLAVLGRSPSAPAIAEMAAQEKQHLASFDKLVVERHVRPTLLTPLWHGAGFALGAASALLGERAAMACTVAVEEVIADHYADQAARLGEDEAELKATIEEFRADEIGHRDTGLEHDAEQMPGYVPFTTAIKAGTRLAIWLSERI